MTQSQRNIRALRGALFMIAASSVGILALMRFPALHFELPVSVSASAHMMLETLSIVVSVLAFFRSVGTPLPARHGATFPENEASTG